MIYAKIVVKIWKPKIDIKQLHTQSSNCCIIIWYGYIYIEKKGQQLSKSINSNKYTLPTRQQLVTQHTCTGGATTKPDVTTIVVTTQTTKILLSQFANYNYLQIFKIRKFLYFLCSIAFFMFQRSVWILYWVSCLYCICIQSLTLPVVVNSFFKLTVGCY